MTQQRAERENRRDASKKTAVSVRPSVRPSACETLPRGHFAKSVLSIGGGWPDRGENEKERRKKRWTEEGKCAKCLSSSISMMMNWGGRGEKVDGPD